MVSRGWKAPREALFATAFYHVIPAPFQAQAAAYLTNAFGNAAAVAAIAIAAAALGLWSVVSGVAYWFAWFSGTLPR
jgi:hypothetical protein